MNENARPIDLYRAEDVSIARHDKEADEAHAGHIEEILDKHYRACLAAGIVRPLVQIVNLHRLTADRKGGYVVVKLAYKVDL